jgi:tetratricopeptide (TPR) repeat protein
MGKHDEAIAALEAAKARDARALDDPLALLAWARSLARTGRTAQAADAFRALLPRASTLTVAERTAAAIEAGMLAMDRGAGGTDEAVAIFREALREAQDVAQGVAVLALALALDRHGDKDEARALLAERVGGDPRTSLASSRARELLGPSGIAESHAMAGLALETTDAGGARDAWEAYLQAAPSGPWAEHARQHLAALGGKRPAPRQGGRPR